MITRSFTEEPRKLSVIKESAEPWKDAAMANSTTPLTLWKPVANEIRPTILHKYKRKEIVKMTSSFRETIGKGGSSTVYLGELVNHGYVAVKLYTPNTPHGEYLFQNEMNVAAMPSHSNIVKVLGFCCEKSTRALVLVCAPFGALDKFIYSDNVTAKYRSFSCHEKYQIALGLAKGIDYLHTGCNVLHRDIKPSNVLLDENLCPKIADFGLSIAMQTQSSFTITTLRGTMGYIAPEAVSLERMTSKIDVYGYGIVLLEMLMRRKPYGDRLNHDEHIVDLAYKVLNGQDGLGLEGYVPDSEMEVGQKMMQVALWCTQAKAESRPSMAKVLDMLQGHVDLIAAPPNPSTGESHYAFGVFPQDSSGATMTFSTINGR